VNTSQLSAWAKVSPGKLSSIFRPNFWQIGELVCSSSCHTTLLEATSLLGASLSVTKTPTPHDQEGHAGASTHCRMALDLKLSTAPERMLSKLYSWNGIYCSES